MGSFDDTGVKNSLGAAKKKKKKKPKQSENNELELMQ